MKNKLILNLILLPALLLGQNLKDVKIDSVLGTNLFLTEDGQFLKLAHIRTVTHLKDNTILSDKISRYAREKIIGKPLKYKKVYESGDTIYVILLRTYILDTKCYNEEYIEKGFGKYEPRDNSELNETLAELESEAREDKEGLWDSKNLIPQVDVESSAILARFTNDLLLGNENLSFWLFNFQYHTTINLNKFTISTIIIHNFKNSSSNSTGIILIPKANFNFTPFGISLGVLFISGDRYFTVLPVGSLRLGHMEKFYLFASLLNEEYMSLLNYGFTIKLKDPYSEITIGKSLTLFEPAVFIDAKLNLYENFLLEVQMQRFIETDKSSFLLGVGLFYD